MKKLSKPMNKQDNVQLYNIGVDRYDADNNLVPNFRGCALYNTNVTWSCNYY